jgi:hypothetical protein
MILKEAGGEVQVIENPLASTKPLVLKAGEIDKKEASKISPMPKGLLDKLTREEILDLLAFVVAGGDPKHKAFGSGHDHGHEKGHH